MAQTRFDTVAKPGDLIEISRTAYNHWAIYIGGNEVVHLTTSSDDADESGPFGVLMVLDSSRAWVRRQKLWEVTGTDDFKINNLLDDTYEPRERHVIVREACGLVGLELPYSVTSNNCEHFVTRLRYGKPESRQVKTAAVIGGAALAGIGIVAVGAIIASLFKSDSKEEEEEEEEERPQRQERYHHHYRQHQRRYRHK